MTVDYTPDSPVRYFRHTELVLKSAGKKLPRWVRLFFAVEFCPKFAIKHQARRVMEAYEPSDTLIPAHYLVTASRFRELAPEHALKVFARSVALFSEMMKLHEEYVARWEEFTNASFIADFFPVSIYVEAWLKGSGLKEKLPEGANINFSDTSACWDVSMDSVTQEQLESLRRKSGFMYQDDWYRLNPVSLKIDDAEVTAIKYDLHGVFMVSTAYGFLAKFIGVYKLISSAYFHAVMMPSVRTQIGPYEAFIIIKSYISWVSFKEKDPLPSLFLRALRELAALCDPLKVTSLLSERFLHHSAWSKHILAIVVDDAFKVGENPALSSFVLNSEEIKEGGLAVNAARAYLVRYEDWPNELPDEYFVAALTEDSIPEAYAELVESFNKSLGKLW